MRIVQVGLALSCLMFSLPGCGTSLDPKEVARASCPVMTDAEFEFFFAGVVLQREGGVSYRRQLEISLGNCAVNTVFDSVAQCRGCVRFIIDTVFGQIP